MSYAGRWFQAHTAFWRALPQVSRLRPLSWHCICVFKRQATILSSQLLQYSEETEKQWNTWARWVLSAVPLLWSKFFGQRQCCAQYHDDINPWIIVLTATLHAGVANCYPDSSVDESTYNHICGQCFSQYSHVHCPQFCPPWRFPSLLLCREVTWCFNCPLLCIVCIPNRPSLILLSLSQQITAHTLCNILVSSGPVWTW